MPTAAYAALGAVGGALITAVASLTVFLIQRASTLRSEHLLRAFESHLSDYENVFVSARLVMDSLRNFRTVSERATDRADPFLFQLLEVASAAAHQFCIAVSWSHNPGMAYLELKLEKKCIRAQRLLLDWLSAQRIHSGDVAMIRVNGKFQPVPTSKIKHLQAGDYQELVIETKLLVLDAPEDKRGYAEIDQAMQAVVKQLKAVMAY